MKCPSRRNDEGRRVLVLHQGQVGDRLDGLARRSRLPMRAIPKTITRTHHLKTRNHPRGTDETQSGPQVCLYLLSCVEKYCRILNSKPSFVFLGQPSDSRSSKRTRSKTKGTEGYPDLQPWPNIPLKKITGVSKAVLNHLSLLDVDELFAIPVIEKFPEVEKDYVAIVESPMDFRTIEEDRLPYYEHIQELQDDLILVFRNCATFNDTSTVFHSFAM